MITENALTIPALSTNAAALTAPKTVATRLATTVKRVATGAGLLGRFAVPPNDADLIEIPETVS